MERRQPYIIVTPPSPRHMPTARRSVRSRRASISASATTPGEMGHFSRARRASMSSPRGLAGESASSRPPSISQRPPTVATPFPSYPSLEPVTSPRRTHANELSQPISSAPYVRPRTNTNASIASSFRVARKPAPELTREELAAIQATVSSRHSCPPRHMLPAPLDDSERWHIVRRPGMPVRRYSARKRHGRIFDGNELTSASYGYAQNENSYDRASRSYSGFENTSRRPRRGSEHILPERMLRTYASSLHLNQAASRGPGGRVGFGLSKISAKLSVATKTLFRIRN